MAAVPVSISSRTVAAASLAVTVARVAAVSITGVTAAAALLNVTVARAAAVSISAVTAAAASFDISVSHTAKIGIRSVTASGASMDLTVSRPGSISMASVTAAAASLDVLLGRSAGIAIRSQTSATATLNITGASDLLGMSICDVVEELLAMWGILCIKSAPDYAKDRAINDVNSALQLVWNNAEGRDYWTNVPITLTLADGENSAALDDDIQNVVGPCRLTTTKRPLTPIGSIGELETFSDLYLDGETASEPVAYHIERNGQTGIEPAKCIFYVTPPVSGASVSFTLDVVREAPRFSRSDLFACPNIPIPHKYVETLLLPIAKYQASSYYLFRQPENKATIDREYQRAFVSLGLADPLPGNAGDNRNKREEPPK